MEFKDKVNFDDSVEINLKPVEGSKEAEKVNDYIYGEWIDLDARVKKRLLDSPLKKLLDQEKDNASNEADSSSDPGRK